MIIGKKTDYKWDDYRKVSLIELTRKLMFKTRCFA